MFLTGLRNGLLLSLAHFLCATLNTILRITKRTHGRKETKGLVKGQIVQQKPENKWKL